MKGAPPTKLEVEKIKLLAASGIRVSTIARRLKRSREFIKNMIESNADDIALSKTAISDENISEYTWIINTSLEQLKNKVEEGDLKPTELARIVGILFDKRQLLKGDPTTIDDRNVTINEQREADRIVGAFKEIATSFVSESENADSVLSAPAVRPALSAPSIDDSGE